MRTAKFLLPDYKENTKRAREYDNDRITMQIVAMILYMLRNMHVS